MEGSKVVRGRLKKQVSELSLPKVTKWKKEIFSVKQRLKLLFGESREERKTKKALRKETMQRASSLSHLLYPIKSIPDIKAFEEKKSRDGVETAQHKHPTSIQEIWLNQPEDIYSGNNCSVAFFSICGDPDDTLTEDNRTHKRYCRDFTNLDLELDSRAALGSRKETYGSDESSSDSSIGELSDPYTSETKCKAHRTVKKTSCSVRNPRKDTFGSEAVKSSTPIDASRPAPSIGLNRRKSKSTGALLGKRIISETKESLQFCTYRSPVKKKAVRRKLQTFSKQTSIKRLGDVKTLAVM